MLDIVLFNKGVISIKRIFLSLPYSPVFGNGRTWIKPIHVILFH